MSSEPGEPWSITWKGEGRNAKLMLVLDYNLPITAAHNISYLYRHFAI